MSSLVLKLFLTPALIGVTSLAGRRWGPGVSGWLVGLPFTSGPIVLFLTLDHGAAFAAAAAAGTLAGGISQATFCVAYGRLARRWHWPLALFGSSLLFAASTAALQHLDLPLMPLTLAVLAVLAVALRLMPASDEAPAASLPRWDIPARMGLATAFVLLLTGLAPALGPRLTGLLAPYPLYAAILAVFAHHLQGPIPAAGVLRGLLFGLFAFAGCFFTLAALLERGGIAVAFSAAIAVALAVQAGSLWAMQQGGRSRPAGTRS